MIVRIIDLGRGHINKDIEVKDFEEAEMVAKVQCNSNLMSSEIEIVQEENKEKRILFGVYVGGFRKVGQIEFI